tara:strand:- start:57 stop:377 length:321 start_codon:yes stop_codon:yes gene_type:complete
MPQSHCSLARLLVDARPSSTTGFDTIRTEFYREEFLKHRECLRQQREAYSECTISEMEVALRRVMALVDELCADGDVDVDLVVSRLLQSFDGVTKLSAWSDPTRIH